MDEAKWRSGQYPGHLNSCERRAFGTSVRGPSEKSKRVGKGRACPLGIFCLSKGGKLGAGAGQSFISFTFCQGKRQRVLRPVMP